MGTLTAEHAPGDVDADDARPARGATWVVARREARLLVRHPLILLGTLLSGLVLVGMGWGELPELARYSSWTGLGLVPLTAAALFTGSLNAGRARRDGTDELYDVLGVTRPQRTTGHLLAAVAVLPLGVILVAAWTGYLYLAGGTGTPNLLELLTGPAVAALAAVAGVAVATWFPSRVVGLLALTLLGVLQIALHDIELSAQGTSHWLAFWHTENWHPAGDTWIRPSGPHLAYLAGLIGLVAVTGRLRHPPRSGPAVMGAAALALAVIAGGLQLQPPTDEEIEALFAQIDHPAEFWTCEQRDTVTYCVFPAYTGWIDAWHRAVGGALEPLPPALRPALRVEQHRHVFLSQVMDELGSSTPRREALERRSERLMVAGEDQGGWPLRVGESFYRKWTGFTLALEAAQRVVGLPVEPTLAEQRLSAANYEDYVRARENPEPGVIFDDTVVAEELPDGGAILHVPTSCRLQGQAREAVALWLAGQVDDAWGQRIRDYRAHLLDPRAAGSDSYGFELPDGTLLTLPNPDLIPWAGWVRWSPTGGDLAAQLLDRPGDQVAATLASDWERWTAATTPTAALADAFDLDAPVDGETYFRRAGLDPARYPEWVAAFPDEPDSPAPVCD